MKSFFKNRQGFTLIEIMAVLVIMGVMASVAVSKINDISGTAEYRALEVGISELNAREMLYWTNVKFQPGGWNHDDDVRNYVNPATGAVYATDIVDLGIEYSLSVTATGGTLSFGSRSIPLIRTVSTNTAAARWAP